jgi:hypothetical protein
MDIDTSGVEAVFRFSANEYTWFLVTACMTRAISSLPVPDSPVTSTGREHPKHTQSFCKSQASRGDGQSMIDGDALTDFGLLIIRERSSKHTSG